MATVHVFVSTGRFHSSEEMRRFIDETYTDDGDGIPSPFMREVGLSEYEPMCIEAIHSGRRLLQSTAARAGRAAEPRSWDSVVLQN